jgi:hypothetical protein
MTVPLTISPAAKRIELCFMASSIVSITILGLTAGGQVGADAPGEVSIA